MSPVSGWVTFLESKIIIFIYIYRVPKRNESLLVRRGLRKIQEEFGHKVTDKEVNV